MTEELYPTSSRELARMRRELAPAASKAFHNFGSAVFAEGALSTKTKQLIAVAAAHVTQCPYCIKGHTRAALREGNSNAEIMEAIWVAAEMRAGAAFAHSVIALAEMEATAGHGNSDSAAALVDGEHRVARRAEVLTR
jgi:AhpD family alkylhydroperoxidase